MTVWCQDVRTDWTILALTLLSFYWMVESNSNTPEEPMTRTGSGLVLQKKWGRQYRSKKSSPLTRDSSSWLSTTTCRRKGTLIWRSCSVLSWKLKNNCKFLKRKTECSSASLRLLRRRKKKSKLKKKSWKTSKRPIYLMTKKPKSTRERLFSLTLRSALKTSTIS